MNHSDWEEIAGRIYQKSRKAAERSADKIPYSAVNGEFDDMTRENICWWTNGFYAGLLWQLYGAFGDTIFRDIARRIEEKLDKTLMNAQGMDHDSGFRWLLTAGANYRLTGSAPSKNRLILAAADLAGRFNPAGNFIRAWNDSGDGATAGWAIIDCMMNLPLLHFVSRELHDPRFSQIAVRHADTALSAFLRPDGSCCHIVEFDPHTGERLRSRGGQGYGHGSAWTRGQGWAIYGFTLSYLHTKDPRYLGAARRAADHFLAHVPESGLIPIDFCQPEEAPEDSSASAIASCGLIELAHATGREEYRVCAEKLLLTLLEKRSDLREETDPILTNCAVAYHNAPHDIPLIYGDYFFTEAILKLSGKETFLW